MATQRTLEIDGHRIRLTHPDKVMYPATGTTKAQVIDYYRRIAAVMVPQAARRPATRKRWVDGVGTEQDPGHAFFRKALEDSAPAWVPRVRIEHRDGATDYPAIDEAAVLVWLAQLAALEIHTPQWRADAEGAPSNPDRLVLDLDPGPGADLADCVRAAFWCREILVDMDLAAVPVTSGSKGLHLYAPLDGSADAEQVDRVAKRLAEALTAEHPDHVVAVQKRALREGRVLVDWSQNNGSKTTITPYSLRGRPRPTVAAPRTWDELESGDLRQLEMDEVLARVEAGEDPLAPLGLDAAGTGDEASRKAPADRRPDRPAPSAGPDRLSVYRSKREASRTPEPVPADPPGESGAAPTFVIQEHHASSLHWDLRLEHEGVLVSWAVPKGPPLSGRANRLAVQTEDHPLAYGSFEGTIPTGEYGAGEVSIWDDGVITVEKWREGEEVIAVLFGRADGGLGGVPRRYALIRTGAKGTGKEKGKGSGSSDRQWLLHLMRDQPPTDLPRPTEPPRPTPPDAEPEPAADPEPAPAVPSAEPAPPRADPIAPMLATAGSRADVDGEDWAFEMKWDGFRAICSVAGDDVVVRSRSGRDLSATFPELAELREAVAPEVRAAGETVLDGEIVALSPDGRPSFSLLQQRAGLTGQREVERARQEQEVHLMLFDVMRRAGRSLLRTPYEERREVLAELITPTEHVQVPPSGRGDLEDAIGLSRQLDLEGVMAKTLSGVYLPGRRTRTWIKLKNARHQDVVIIGRRRGKGERAGGIGSLLVAVPDADGHLRYAGRVGTGFTDRALARLAEQLDRRERRTPPVPDVPAADRRDADWVRADLVGEVRYAERTPEGRLRHAVWRGLRPEIDAADVRWE